MRQISLNNKTAVSFIFVYSFYAGITILQALGVLPSIFAWITALGVLSYIILSPGLRALQMFVVLIPWYTVLPNNLAPGLSSWRLLLIALGIKAVFIAANSKSAQYKINHRQELVFNNSPFNRYWFLLAAFALISALWAVFPVAALKQIIFIANAYVLYVAGRIFIRSENDALKVLKSGFYSALTIIGIGFFQWILSKSIDLWVLWQYWALRVTDLFYGTELSSVVEYSNSWITKTQNGLVLRMFGTLPDSHAFGLIAAQLILVSFVFVYKYRQEVSGKYWLNLGWLGLVSASLALVLSGTRSVWVGSLVPLGALGWLSLRNKHKLFKLLIIPLICLLLAFPAAWIIETGISAIKAGAGGNAFMRVLSVTDTDEESNAGRLRIWQDSLAFAWANPFGVGFNNFIVSLSDEQNYSNATKERNPTYNLPQRYVSAHSLYIQVLVELGIIGTVLLALAFWNTLKWYIDFIWQNLKSKTILWQQLAVGSWLLYIVWVACQAVFDITILNDRVLMFTFLGFAISSRLIELNSGKKHV